jgi:uncharacterized membrane protein YgaE (UPF0421/DUF939 family)
MINAIIPDYTISLYAFIWSFWFLIHAFVKKNPIYFRAWALVQTLITGLLFFDRFVNKGYCLLVNCEPTNTLKQFFNTNFDENTVILLGILSLTLLFLVIIKMHRFIERHREKWQNKI